MDPTRFDALARSLTTDNPSRRVILRTIAGGFAAAGLATAPAADAKRKKKKKKKCKAPKTRCGKRTCVDLDTNPKHCGDCKTHCPFEIDCVGGNCILRDIDDPCDTDGQCTTGQCSIIFPFTCRQADCKETGSCKNNSDCCNGVCLGTNNCCNGVC